MDEGRLYDVVDYILNEATEKELEVLHAALEKRADGEGNRGPMGLDIGKMADESARGVKESLDLSKSQMRDMVKGMVSDLIRKNAPELEDEQIVELMDDWVPDNTIKNQKKGSSTGPRSAMPPKVMLSMIAQFVAYSTGTMSASEKLKMTKEIPGWTDRYWAEFSPIIRRIIKLFLDGNIDGTKFWMGVTEELGIDLD